MINQQDLEAAAALVDGELKLGARGFPYGLVHGAGALLPLALVCVQRTNDLLASIQKRTPPERG